MIRNWQKMAGLGLAFLALGGLATWDEWKTKKDEAEKETKGLITSIKPASVTGIVFHSTEDSDTGNKSATPAGTPSKSVDATFKLVNDRWQMLTPIQSLADQQAIADLLKNITEYKTESEVASGKDKWTTFGLANPRRKIELETSDGKKTTFYVGINSPVGFSVYTATSSSEAVYSGSQYIATSTSKSLFDLREKRLFTLNAADISGFKLSLADGKSSGTKSGDKWTLTSPTSAPASMSDVNNLINDITGLKAAEFLDSPDKSIKDALSAKKLFAEIELVSDKATTEIKIAEVKDAVYALIGGNPTIFKLSNDTKSKVHKTFRDLRDKKIFSFHSEDVEKVSLDGEFFHRIGNDWYTAADSAKLGADGKFPGTPEQQPKRKDHIRNLVVDLEYATADDIYAANSPEAKHLPAAPLHRINLNLGGGKPPVAIDIWLSKENPEQIFMRETGKEQLFKAKRIIIQAMNPRPTVAPGDEAMPALKGLPAGTDMPK
jgi:Domain of unknown function (DUF4340)